MREKKWDAGLLCVNISALRLSDSTERGREGEREEGESEREGEREGGRERGGGGRGRERGRERGRGEREGVKGREKATHISRGCCINIVAIRLCHFCLSQQSADPSLW